MNISKTKLKRRLSNLAFYSLAGLVLVLAVLFILSLIFYIFP